MAENGFKSSGFRANIAMNAPCKGCEERSVGCHGKCAKYEAFRTNLLEAKRLKKETEVKYGYVSSIFIKPSSKVYFGN